MKRTIFPITVACLLAAVLLFGQTVINGYRVFMNVTAPATPASGTTSVYTDATNKVLSAKDDAGNVTHTVRTADCSGTGLVQKINADGTVTCAAGGGGGSGSITEFKEYKAARCQNTVAGAGFSTPSTGAPVPACVTGSNVLAAVLQFEDTATETVQDHFRYPASITAVALTIKWRTSVTSGNVVWQLATACVADAETVDPSWNTAQTVTDAAKGTTLQTNDATISSVTTTGCAAGEEMFFRFFRDPAHASDTLGATAELISLAFEITRTI
jgi:hypothetical protein